MMNKYLGPLIGLIFALSLSFFAHESPISVAFILFKSTFGSVDDFCITLFYTTPLIFTGLAVALPFRAGLFNIGAEGQLVMAAAAATSVGVLFPQVTNFFAPLLAVTFALLIAALWGGLVGWLKAQRQVHEVITTIMLNFIAAGLTSWFALQVIPSTESQNPESAKVAIAYQLQSIDPLIKIFPDSGLNFSFIIAILAAVLIWFVLEKTSWGFQIKATGENPEACRRSGINIVKMQMQVMMIAGLLSACVGISEVLLHSNQFKIGFSPDYGFIGIAVALLARHHPLGLIGSAFFWAFLHKGSLDLDLETESITRDFSKIIQAFLILSLGLGQLKIFQFGKKHD
jgi:general nucleoside transport system permease protein